MRQVLLVAGSGRSGTSMLAQTLGAIGYLVPQPEVEANETNPRGFGESRWVVDFHARLLKRARVRISDADPAAPERVADPCADPAVRDELREWLERQFAESDKLVIKDPRLLWFLPLWEGMCVEMHADVAVLSMLRHPAEVVRSKLSWYSHVPDNEASSLAGWINVMLDVEASTRRASRCYVHFADLMDDWAGVVDRVSESIGSRELAERARVDQARVDAMFDGSLYRSKAAWEDLQVFDSLVDLAREVWDNLCTLVDDPHDQAVQTRLDELRHRYGVLHLQAAEVARSSMVSEQARLQRENRRLERQRARLERRLARTRARLRAARQDAPPPSPPPTVRRLASAGRRAAARLRG